jgi:hypothetical protein
MLGPHVDDELAGVKKGSFRHKTSVTSDNEAVNSDE